MKFSIKDFSSKCDQIRSKLRIWSHLLKKLLMENFIFCAVMAQYNDHVPSANTVLNTQILELENFTFSALKTVHIE